MNSERDTIRYVIQGRSHSYYLAEVNCLFAAIWAQGGVSDKDLPELIRHEIFTFSAPEKVRVINFINQSEEDLRLRYYSHIPIKDCHYKGRRGRKISNEIFIFKKYN